MQRPSLDPISLIRPRRKISGISAILLPFSPAGDIDWPGFRAHVRRTLDAGLTPAVNMDTGFVNLLDDGTRRHVLEQTREVASGKPFVAGAFVADQQGDPFQREAYCREIAAI